MESASWPGPTLKGWQKHIVHHSYCTHTDHLGISTAVMVNLWNVSKVTCYDIWDDTPAFTNTWQQLFLKARPVLTQFLEAMWEWNMLYVPPRSHTRTGHPFVLFRCGRTFSKVILKALGHLEQSQKGRRDRKRTPPEKGMWQILGRTRPWEQLCLEGLYFRPCCCSGWPDWKWGKG